MTTQVITIGHGGEISGLQRKRGDGVNVQQFGHAKTERVSEIVWSENMQAWTVLPIRGPFKDNVLIRDLWEMYMGSEPCWGAHALQDDAQATLLFEHYEDAVKAEIAFLDAARRRGVF